MLTSYCLIKINKKIIHKSNKLKRVNSIRSWCKLIVYTLL